MLMMFTMFSGWVAQAFGLRHHPVDDPNSEYRKYDVLAGVMLPILMLLSLSFAGAVFLPGILPAWAESMFTIAGFGLIFLGGVLWKPVLEHLELLHPYDVSATARQRIVIVARAIPYIYAFVAIMFSFLMGCLMVITFGTLITQAMGIAPHDRDYTQTMLICGGVILLGWAYLCRSVMSLIHKQSDWGLQNWSGWVEAGQQHPAGQRFFGPLDATLGRIARAILR